MNDGNSGSEHPASVPPGPDWRPEPRRVLAEFVGTAFLLMAIVGSGIMAETLTDDGVCNCCRTPSPPARYSSP